MSAPRRRRAEDRPDELLDAAIDLFGERGFAATRIEDIARRAHVAKGTVYLYFPSKQAMFEALVRRSIVPNIERVETLVSQADAPAPQILRQVLTTLPGILSDPRVATIPKLVIAEAGNLPDVARFYKAAVIDRGLGLLAGLIRRGIAAGDFRPVDPERTAKLCVGPLLLAIIWRTTFEPATGDALELPAFLNDHLDMLMRGLRPEGGGNAPSR